MCRWIQNGLNRKKDHHEELIWNKLLVAYCMKKVTIDSNNGTHGANIIFVFTDANNKTVHCLIAGLNQYRESSIELC